MNRFDRSFRRRLWRLSAPYWRSDKKWQAFQLLSTIVLLSASLRGASIVISYVNRDLMTALSYRDEQRFYHTLLLVIIYNLIGAPVSAVAGYLVGRLMINWRQWLTEQFLDRTVDRRAFYRISLDSRIDNPDQRISEDVNSFVSFTVTFATQLLEGVITGTAFLIVLWLISPILVGALAGCVIAGSLLAVIIGRPLIGINFNQRRVEADFRYALVGLRYNAEEIAFYGGERREQVNLLSRLYGVVRNYHLLIEWQRNLAFFTYAYDLLLPLVPFFILAPRFFDGRIELGKITQASAAFITLRASFSIIIDQFNGLSSYAAVVERLGVYIEACIGDQGLHETAGFIRAGETGQHIEIVEANCFATEILTLKTPDLRKTLIREISFELEAGEALLIIGKSGTGKTSMLRAISGLWRSGSGRIVRPPLSEVMFIPQRPYMIFGSLRDQLSFPLASRVSDKKLLAILDTVSLGDLVERVGGLDVEVNWKNLLSLGEQQGIAFARLLLNRPTYAFLDEATSAMDLANEEIVYNCLASARINVVSVGQRTSLMKYHDQVLELLGDGSWRIGASEAQAK